MHTLLCILLHYTKYIKKILIILLYMTFRSTIKLNLIIYLLLIIPALF